MNNDYFSVVSLMKRTTSRFSKGSAKVGIKIVRGVRDSERSFMEYLFWLVRNKLFFLFRLFALLFLVLIYIRLLLNIRRFPVR